MNENSSIRIRRTLQATRSRVFKAWTDADTMRAWFAPRDVKVLDAQVRPEINGRYQVTMGDDNEVVTVAGVYKEIVPDELLRFTWQWRERPDDRASEVTVRLAELDGATELLLVHSGMEDEGKRDKHVRGWTGCLDNLSKLLKLQVHQ